MDPLLNDLVELLIKYLGSEQDNDGQIVIYTGLKPDGMGGLTDFQNDDDRIEGERADNDMIEQEIEDEVEQGDS